MTSNIVVLHNVLNFPASEHWKFNSVVYFSERLDLLIVNTYLHKYFKARSTSIKVIQITFTEANFTIIYALADDKKTPSPSQSSRKRYEVVPGFLHYWWKIN